jgi:hypothetical protein
MGSFQALLVNTVFFSSQKQTPWCSSTSLPPNACVTGGDCGQKRGRQLYYKLLLPLQVKSLRKSRVLNLGGNLLRQEISLYPLQAFWYWRPSFLGGCIAFLSFCFEIESAESGCSSLHNFRIILVAPLQHRRHIQGALQLFKLYPRLFRTPAADFADIGCFCCP